MDEKTRSALKMQLEDIITEARIRQLDSELVLADDTGRSQQVMHAGLEVPY